MAKRITPEAAFASHLRDERYLFAAKIRAARALIGWSQQQFADASGLTQRAIHKLETASVEPRRATTLAIETVFARLQITFTQDVDGTLHVSAPAVVFTPVKTGARDGDRLRVIAGGSGDAG